MTQNYANWTVRFAYSFASDETRYEVEFSARNRHEALTEANEYLREQAEEHGERLFFLDFQEARGASVTRSFKKFANE